MSLGPAGDNVLGLGKAQSVSEGDQREGESKYKQTWKDGLLRRRETKVDLSGPIAAACWARQPSAASVLQQIIRQYIEQLAASPWNCMPTWPQVWRGQKRDIQEGLLTGKSAAGLYPQAQYGLI